MAFKTRKGDPSKKPYQCPECRRGWLREELSKPSNLADKFRKKMHYQPGDEICPACREVVISQDDKERIESGEVAETSQLSDNRVSIGG